MATLLLPRLAPPAVVDRMRDTTRNRSPLGHVGWPRPGPCADASDGARAVTAPRAKVKIRRVRRADRPRERHTYRMRFASNLEPVDREGALERGLPVSYGLWDRDDLELLVRRARVGPL